MAEYAVSPGTLSDSIYVGRTNAAGTAFTDKQERTDMVLAAVAEYVHQHYDGGMIASFPGLGLVLEVKVRLIPPDPDPDATTEEPRDA